MPSHSGLNIASGSVARRGGCAGEIGPAPRQGNGHLVGDVSRVIIHGRTASSFGRLSCAV